VHSVDSERSKKRWKAGTWLAEGGDGRWCARKDSRPLLKAKEPSGRAESARSRRVCRGAAVIVSWWAGAGRVLIRVSRTGMV